MGSGCWNKLVWDSHEELANPMNRSRSATAQGSGVIEIACSDGGLIWRLPEDPSVTLEPAQTAMTDPR